MLKIKQSDYNRMIHHLKTEYPNEGCGILAGKGGEVARVFTMTNADQSPSSFGVDPKELLMVSKEIRQTGLEVMAVFHSHVATQAYPSRRDCEAAAVTYPDASYVVVSLAQFDRPLARSFKIHGDMVQEEELSVVSESG